MISSITLKDSLIRKLLTMQTDLGGEYQKLSYFFKRVGISHLVSCAHVHQQNVPVERKHRNIVEMGLSLLAFVSMPLKYWDEAFLTSLYLINHLPTKIIDSQTPMECLFGNKGEYSLLCIFVCACWPNLAPTTTKSWSSNLNIVHFLVTVTFIRAIIV
jgi:hypothetical protein